jgi:hypothetical protein
VNSIPFLQSKNNECMRIISIITSVFICLYLAGCGTGDNIEAPPASPDSADTVIVEAPIKPPKPPYKPPAEVGDSINILSWTPEDVIEGITNSPCWDRSFRVIDEEKTIESQEGNADIVGKWKFILSINWDDNRYVYDTTYYSCRSVFYEFAEDSTVTIVSDTSAIQSGTFNYSHYIYFWLNDICQMLLAPNLVIGGSKLYCEIVGNIMMVFSVSYVDKTLENLDSAFNTYPDRPYQLFVKIN